MEYEARASAVHKSLLEIKTFAGVEKRLAIGNGTIALALVMGTEQPAFLLLALAVHIFLVWVTKKDPYMIDIYKKYTQLGDVYDPWPKRTNKRNSRPVGFGKDTLC